MKKKIIALITVLALFLTMSVSSFAAGFDLSAITGIFGGGDDEGGASILDEEILQEIMTAVMSSEGVIDITNIVMEVVAKISSGDIQNMAKDEVVSVVTQAANTIADSINTVYGNKDLIIKYDPLKVVDNLFGLNTQALTTAPAPTTGADELVIGPGDVDGDGRITAADARLILRRAARLITFTVEQEARADVDGDGKITANDARIVLRVSAGLDRMPTPTTVAPTTAESTTAA